MTKVQQRGSDPLANVAFLRLNLQLSLVRQLLDLAVLLVLFITCHEFIVSARLFERAITVLHHNAIASFERADTEWNDHYRQYVPCRPVIVDAFEEQVNMLLLHG